MSRPSGIPFSVRALEPPNPHAHTPVCHQMFPFCAPTSASTSCSHCLQTRQCQSSYCQASRGHTVPATPAGRVPCLKPGQWILKSPRTADKPRRDRPRRLSRWSRPRAFRPAPHGALRTRWAFSPDALPLQPVPLPPSCLHVPSPQRCLSQPHRHSEGFLLLSLGASGMFCSFCSQPPPELFAPPFPTGTPTQAVGAMGHPSREGPRPQFCGHPSLACPQASRGLEISSALEDLVDFQRRFWMSS